MPRKSSFCHFWLYRDHPGIFCKISCHFILQGTVFLWQQLDSRLMRSSLRLLSLFKRRIRRCRPQWQSDSSSHTWRILCKFKSCQLSHWTRLRPCCRRERNLLLLFRLLLLYISHLGHVSHPWEVRHQGRSCGRRNRLMRGKMYQLTHNWQCWCMIRKVLRSRWSCSCYQGT